MGFRCLMQPSALLLGSLGLGLWAGLSPAQAASFTIFHNNDGESKLTPSNGEGGAAQFVTLLNSLRDDAVSNNRIPLTLSSGDNFLAGTAFNASLASGTFYDALVLNEIGYDAIAFGNHDFDFGPDILADFIQQVDPDIPYLGANLDFAGEPSLNALVGSRIQKSVIIDKGGEQIGVIGAIFEELETISSPRNVAIGPVRDAVQAEIDALQTAGVNKIVLISHLQNIDEELALIPELRGIDVVIAGGGDNLLTDDPANLLPSDQAAVTAGDATISGPYPIQATNADGEPVVVVTTAGDYKYVGQLEVEFDDAGIVTNFGGQAVRVLDSELPGPPDATVTEQAIEPVQAAEAALAENVIGTSEVALNGERGSVRTTETNLGNLIADALLWQAQQLAEVVGTEVPTLALQNGGGIRNNDLRGPGDITEKDTFDILPFSNFVSVIEGVTPTVLKTVLENAYSNVEGVDGRFAQVAGFKVGIDLTADPFNRVVDVTLDDGTELVKNGQILPDAPTVAVATIDFLARGGDGYAFDLPFTNVGVSYQQALANYIEQNLNGDITAAAYPEGGEGRIFTAQVQPGDGGESVPEPAAVLGLLATGLLGARLRQRRNLSA